MTATEIPATSAPVHPLAPMTPEEIDAAREIVTAAGLVTEPTRFVYVGVEEPAKSEWTGSPARRLRVVLLDRETGVGTTAVVDVVAGELVESRSIDAVAEGQPGLLEEEFDEVEGILLESPEWLAALAKRGIDPERVRAVPLSAGNFGLENEVGKRLCRILAFVQYDEDDLPWAHPIDGVCAYVDLIAKSVFSVDDDKVLPVPEERSQWDAEPHAQPAVELKPIEITQPEGPSFTLDGHHLKWANWDFRFGFDVREGLALYNVTFVDPDSGETRRILDRASIPEMVVPYGDPQPARYWINYFDQGEYLLGRFTNSLELGCDCLGDITYVDAVVCDETGHPRRIGNAICIHEEDYGVLWKHTDLFNGMSETRRQRRLVVSNFATIGNYDYGFYWYLYLDGTIEFEAKATGIVFPSAYTGPDGFATEMAPGLGAPFHQHLFAARLDFAVDGSRQAVDEVDAVRVPVGPDNPHGNAFRQQKTRLVSEQQARRKADNLKSRHWLITNPDRQNRLGLDVGYALYPEGQPTLLADPSSVASSRAAFATEHLWVLPYDAEQRWPAGDFVNQSPAGAGMPAWTAGDRDLDGEDLVVWHTFGLTHFPRPEDWPVMPVDYTGFTLKPVGFFDRNPSLGVPRSSSGDHCEHH
ncbi:MAG TPA: primary-amine oxidase [Amycolatopsis sp.]|nr:primary-amine oxidase [Amycolatopsis sp.]